MRSAPLVSALAAIALGGCTAGSAPQDDGAGNGERASAGNESAALFSELMGDPAAGEAVFARCQQCHTVQPGVNRTGPTLHGIVGRPAASVGDFNYSPAMAGSGLVWDEETLFQYLEQPQQMVRGSRMIFAGIPDPQNRADLIAYLATQQ